MGVGSSAALLREAEEGAPAEAAVPELFRKWRLAEVRVAWALMEEPLTWRNYFESVWSAEERRSQAEAGVKRAEWHPATRGYAMVPDEESIESLANFRVGELRRPPREAFEDDAHTDDSSSDSDDKIKPFLSSIIPRLPAAWDPAVRSPVHFGFSGTTVADVRRVDERRGLDLKSREAKVADAQREKRRARIESFRKGVVARRKAREEQFLKLRERHERESRTRAADAKIARDLLVLEASSDELLRAHDEQTLEDEEAIRRATTSELAHVASQNKAKDERDAAELRKREEKARIMAIAEKGECPGGDALEEEARSELREAEADLNTACAALEDAEERIDAFNHYIQRRREDTTTAGKLKRFVRECEGEVNLKLRALDDAEVLMHRAVLRRDRENQVVGLWELEFLEMKVALAASCGRATLREKLKIILELFVTDHHHVLSKEAVTIALKCLCRVLKRLKFFRADIPDAEIDAASTRAFLERSVTIMSAYDAQLWITQLVAQSRFLSSLFGDSLASGAAAYGEIGAFQRRAMPPIRSFEVGLFGLPDLKYHVARQLAEHRPQLCGEKKKIIHERALALGVDDPLKSDYSRFILPKTTKKTRTVVPLSHGHLHNLADVEAKACEKAACTLQNVYRAKRSREDAEAKARIAAFWEARARATKEAKDKVKVEFEAKESSTGLARHKWDAKVRIVQAKNRMDRPQAVSLLEKEAMEAAVREVHARFEEIAATRGGGRGGGGGGESLQQQQQQQQQGLANALFDDDGDDDDDNKELKDERIAAMICGRFPTELYETGETALERTLRHFYSDPDCEMLARLQALDVTLFKAKEMMLELPSKRLLLRYCLEFMESPSRVVKYPNAFPGFFSRRRCCWEESASSPSTLTSELNSHFGLKEAASAKIGDILASDFEFGLCDSLARQRRAKNSSGEDFVEAATRGARVVLAEYFRDHKPHLVATREPDGRAVGRGPGYRFEYENIRFEIMLDDHGIFNGCDECAAKAAGNYRKAAREFERAAAAGGDIKLRVPQTATIDLWGFRVLAVAKMTTKNARLVHGTSDRGKTVKNSHRGLDRELGTIARTLNLARHAVKGSRDLTPKEIWTSVDVRGYYAPASDERYVLNLWRAFPGEDPRETPHFAPTPRGASMFWRLLRPEFVKRYDTPLSADANCAITRGTPDAERQADVVRKATRHLCESVVVDLANRMNSFDLEEFKARGINVRHLGLLRSCFWRPLDGTARCDHGSRFLRTSVDQRRDVRVGDKIRVLENEVFEVAEDVVTDTRIPLTRKYLGLSTNDVTAEAGVVANPNSKTLRSQILGEMVARAIKSLFRLSLRRSAFVAAAIVPSVATRYAVELLNCVTGAHEVSDAVWREQIGLLVRQKFGRRAISDSEILRLRTTMAVDLRWLLRRVSEIAGISITPRAMLAFDGAPSGFEFAVVDVRVDHPVVKHGIPRLDNHLLAKADAAAGIEEKEEDPPLLYLPLTERRGSRVARNLGRWSRADGLYANVACAPEGACFSGDQSYVVVKQAVPFEGSFALECWAQLADDTTTTTTTKIAVMTGRGALSVLGGVWCATLFLGQAELSVRSATTSCRRWTHVCGSYDGTEWRLYVDGALEQAVEVEPERRAVEIQLREETAKQLAALDAEEKAAIIERQHNLLVSPHLHADAKKRMEKAEFRYEMDARADEKGLRRLLTKQEALEEARAAMMEARVKEVKDKFEKMREEFRDKHESDRRAAKERSRRPVVTIGASCPGGRSHRHFWTGRLSRVAVYDRALTPDDIRSHFFSKKNSSTNNRVLYVLDDDDDDDRSRAAGAEILSQHATDEILKKLEARRSTKTLLRILEIMPDGPEHANKAAKIFEAVLRIVVEKKGFEKKDFEIEELRMLSRVPRRFGWDKSRDKPFLTLAARAYRLVLSDLALADAFGRDDDDDLSWAASLESDIILRNLVMAADRGDDDDDDPNNRLDFLKEDPNLSNSDLRKICNNRRLASRLDVSGCASLADDAVEWCLKATSQLRCLVLDNCPQLSGVLYDGGALPAALQTLSIQNNAAMAEGIPWETLPNLTALNVSYTPFNDDAAAAAACLELFHASLCSALTDVGVIAFAAKNRSLTSLDLSFCCGISDDGVSVVAETTRTLIFLRLEGVYRLTDVGVRRVTHNLWNLEDLNIGGVYLVTDEAFVLDDERIAAKQKMLSALEHLDVSGCSRLTDRAFEAIQERCRRLKSLRCADLVRLAAAPTLRRRDELQTLDLSGCVEIADDAVTSSVRCHNLTSASLRGCVLLTDAAVQHLSLHSPKITTLRISKCRRMTDAVACAIVERLWLDTLEVAHLARLTDAAVELLAMEQGGLRDLDLSHTNITDASLEAIRTHARALRFLKVVGCERLVLGERIFFHHHHQCPVVSS